MHLTIHTDYSLRVLIYLGVNRDGLATIDKISESYGISRNHLTKVVHNLARLGWIRTIRGRTGGMELNHAPEDINIGAVVRQTEPNFHIVGCFDPSKPSCVIAPACSLKHVLYKAKEGFLQVLDGYTLSDLIGNERELATLLTGALEESQSA
jgi:Rrf2 family transcriptional regulator, nitric oxide-sensitive transcriptional repressor